MTQFLRHAPMVGESKTMKKLGLIFHGYGSNGHDVIGLGHRWKRDHWVFLAPNALEECDHNGYQWFNLGPNITELTGEDCIQAAHQVCHTVDATLKQVNLQWSDVVVIGFSQGGALALEIGLHHRKVAGIMVYAGFLLPQRAVKYTPPCLWVHGQQDEVVPFSSSQTGVDFLKTCNVPVHHHSISALAHNINEEGLAQGETFLNCIK